MYDNRIRHNNAIWCHVLYSNCVMEKIGRESHTEAIRQRIVAELVDCIHYRKDSELAYYFMLLHGGEFGELSRMKLVQTVVDDPNQRGTEMAYRLLRDQPTLDQEARDALFGRIVTSGDRTTCDLALGFIPRLGVWERKLRDVLSS